MNLIEAQVLAALDENTKILSQIALNQSRIVALLGRHLSGIGDGDRSALASGSKTTLPRIQMLQRQIEELSRNSDD